MMTMTTEQIGVSRPRFTILNETAAEHPWRGLYAGGIFAAAVIPMGLMALVFRPGPVVITYLIAVSVYGTVREIRHGYETLTTLAWRVVTLRNFAMGELYVLDDLRTALKGGGGR